MPGFDAYQILIEKYLDDLPFVISPITEDFEKIRGWIDYWLSQNVQVEILSSSGKYRPDEVQRQKRVWLKHHGLDHLKANLVTSATHKARFSQPGSILIDDYLKNVNSFTKAGGVGILHTTAIQTEAKMKEIGIKFTL